MHEVMERFRRHADEDVGRGLGADGIARECLDEVGDDLEMSTCGVSGTATGCGLTSTVPSAIARIEVTPTSMSTSSEMSVRLMVGTAASIAL